ncbi:MAG: histidine phosphatase family protein [Coprothermobacterota bacterium]|nr:histidine phosphatase family protein [Coprothermobacterota bacterium]
MRHGIAEPLSSTSPEDCQRPLTFRGKERTKEVAIGLQTLRVHPQRIASSPLVRCMETAQVVHSTLEVEAPLVQCEHLAPAGDLGRLLLWLAEGEERVTLLVGHSPDISRFASLLVSPSEEVGLPFKRAGVCRIDFPDAPALGEGTLCWFLPPRLLRRLGEKGGSSERGKR